MTFTIEELERSPHSCKDIFLEVAQKGETSYAELSNKLGLTYTAISWSLSEAELRGLEWFSISVPSDKRHCVISLSQKGSELYRSLQSI